MPASGLLVLLDDIATALDDVSVMTKVAATKTAGVLGDDLALNVQQFAGVRANRELPVVWAVAKGSAVNKVILLPAALAVSAFAPWAVLPLLMVGGVYLCFEGAEKLAHKALDRNRPLNVAEIRLAAEQTDPPDDIAAMEKGKIKGAIRTDFVLSAEIVTIALGTVAEETLLKQVAVLISIAVIMTVGVYGLVAGIVRLDDIGFYLTRREGIALFSRFLRGLGRCLLRGVPYLMRTLSYVGTAAMFLVGGGILAHGFPGADDIIHRRLVEPAAAVPVVGNALALVAPLLADGAIGVVAGVFALVAVRAIAKAGMRMTYPPPADQD